MGLDSNGNVKDSLSSLIKDMVEEKQKLINSKEEKLGTALDDNHPIKKAKKALEDVSKSY